MKSASRKYGNFPSLSSLAMFITLAWTFTLSHLHNLPLNLIIRFSDMWHIDKTPVNREEHEGLKRKALDIHSGLYHLHGQCKSLQRFTVQKDIPIELLRCLRENPWFRFMQRVYADKQQLLKPLCYSLKLVFTHIKMFSKPGFWTIPQLTKSILYSDNQPPLS